MPVPVFRHFTRERAPLSESAESRACHSTVECRPGHACGHVSSERSSFPSRACVLGASPDLPRFEHRASSGVLSVVRRNMPTRIRRRKRNVGSLARAATGVGRGGNDGAASYASYTTVIAAPDVAVGISGLGVGADASGFRLGRRDVGLSSNLTVRRS